MLTKTRRIGFTIWLSNVETPYGRLIPQLDSCERATYRTERVRETGTGIDLEESGSERVWRRARRRLGARGSDMLAGNSATWQSSSSQGSQMRFVFWTVIAIFGIVLLMRIFGKGGKVLSETDRVVQTLAMVLRFVMYGVGAFLVVKFVIYIFASMLSSYDFF